MALVYVQEGKAALVSLRWSTKVEQNLINAAKFVPRYLQRFRRRYFFPYKALYLELFS